jgi:sialic acid synthase SpsE
VDKAAMAAELAEMKAVFGKSVVTARDLPAGHCLETADLACRKPGTGIPASRAGEIAGRRLARALPANTLLAEEDLA